jgi:hypothetical protein
MYGTGLLTRSLAVVAVRPKRLQMSVPYANALNTYMVVVVAFFAFLGLSVGRLRLIIQIIFVAGIGVAVAGISWAVFGGSEGNQPLKAVLSQIDKVAPTDSTVLITGETRTGKELIARAVHKRSERSEHAFISVNCAAFAPTLISSELFGHKKGPSREPCNAESAGSSLPMGERFS